MEAGHKTSTESSSRRSQELPRGCDLHLLRSVVLGGGGGDRGVRQNGDTGKRAKAPENQKHVLPNIVAISVLCSGEVNVFWSNSLHKAWGHN